MINGHLKCFSRERMRGVMNLCLSDRICKIFLVYLKVYGYTFSFMINTQISDRTRPLFASDKDQSQTYLKFVQEHYKKRMSMLFLNLCKAFDSGRRVVRHKRWQFRLEGVRRAHNARRRLKDVMNGWKKEWSSSDRRCTRYPPPAAGPRLYNAARYHYLILCAPLNDIFTNERFTCYILHCYFILRSRLHTFHR